MSDQKDWGKIWEHFNRLQKRVMADLTTIDEFFAQDEEERLYFYNWMQDQCGEFSSYI